jgi:hypothetical protein
MFRRSAPRHLHAVPPAGLEPARVHDRSVVPFRLDYWGVVGSDRLELSTSGMSDQRSSAELRTTGSRIERATTH